MAGFDPDQIGDENNATGPLRDRRPQRAIAGVPATRDDRRAAGA